MKKIFSRLILFIGIICLISNSFGYSEENPSLQGHWEGKIDIPGMELEVNIDFSLKDDGTWNGDISIPAQSARDIPLSNITQKDSDVSFTISGIPGDPTFKGKFDESGTKITGDFTQGDQTFPFYLETKISPSVKAKDVLSGFDDVVKGSLKALNVPGIALAIVKDNEVIYAKGFGFRDMERKLPVTPDTLMAIGSSSKAFTTYAMGTLVDQGKLDWDSPVRNYIHWFRLKDPVMGERLTPRDMVTHRSGLPRHDLVWYNNFTASREEFVKSLAFLEPTADLRGKWQYNNLMYLTSGYLVEVLTGKQWEDAIRSLVFKPLGMKRSNFSVEDSQKDNDFALPYREKDKNIEKIPFRNITNIGPAGSINSCINDMSQWVMVHINRGKLGDKQLINPTTLQDMHLAHMPTGGTPTRPDISPADYGMGWFVDNYRGHQRVHHGGNIDGFSALVSMFPHEGYGFVALTNLNGTGLPELIIRHAADLLFELDYINWIGDAAKRKAKREEADEEAEKKREVRRKTGTKPAHKLDEYIGDYTHPGYGKLNVFMENGSLIFTFNGIQTPLEHWHYETFNGKEAEDNTFKEMKLTFRTNVDGNVAELAAPFEPTTGEIIFKKQPDTRLFDPEYLKRFTGKYDLIGQILNVSLKGNSLTLHIPGQPLYDLVPELGGGFGLKQLKIIHVEFVKDEEGNISGAEIHQPGGVFTASRIKE